MNKILKYGIMTVSIVIIGVLVYFTANKTWTMITASDNIRVQMAKDFAPYYAIDYDFESDKRNSSYDDISDRLILKNGSLLVHEKEILTSDSEYSHFFPKEILPRLSGSHNQTKTTLESYYFISDKSHKDCLLQKKRRMQVFSDYFNKHFDYFQNEIVDFDESTSYLKTTNFLGYQVPKLITVCTQGKMVTLFGIIDEK